MKFIRIILFPLVPFYYLVTYLRNLLYDLGWLPSKSYDIPIICVGNLSTGGTGKSPMIEYLIRRLKDKYQIATLSRGYKRQSEGFVLANSDANVSAIGDEPYQFYSKFPEVMVAVDANRQNGIEELLSGPKQPEIILLDDAFQHRRVSPGFNILLTSYGNPYFKDFVLPTGNLREPRSGAKRANMIIVTKCPEVMEPVEKEKIKVHLNPKFGQEVFFSSISYPDKVESQKGSIQVDKLPKFTLLTGIANPQPLKDYLVRMSLEFDHLEYPDHHNYRASDIAVLEEKSLIITTEKDFVRLKEVEPLKGKLYYLPITFQLDRAEEFDRLVFEFLAKET